MATPSGMNPVLSPDSEVGKLALKMAQLSQCKEPADLIYNGHTLISLDEPPMGAIEDYSLTVACRISTILARLSELSKPNHQCVLTPRGVLMELMDIVRHGLFLSLPPAMQHVGKERESLASAFHLYLSSRRIPTESIVEGLYNITYVSVKLRVELVTLQLKRRIEEEVRVHAVAVDKAGGRDSVRLRTAEEELAALLVTQTLLHDFIEVFHNVLLAVPAVTTSATVALNSALPAACAPGSEKLCIADANSLHALLPTLVRYYYQLGDWVLVTANAATVSPISLTRVTKVVLDDTKGLIELELRRPHAGAPWGLLFNERGRLISLDASMRIGEKARQLQALLRCSLEGARVTSVNGVEVRVARGSHNDSNYNTAVLEAVQTASQHRKGIKVTVRSDSLKAAALHAPAELLFSIPLQGGEGASGQRAWLLLHKLNRGTPWQFAVDEDLIWYPPPPRLLSAHAADFIVAYRHRLRLLAVNGVEVQSGAQVRDLVSRVEVLLLELVVVPMGTKEKLRWQQQQKSDVPVDSRGNSDGAESNTVGRAGAATQRSQMKPSGEMLGADDVAQGAASVVERRVREATQRLLLSHAQREEIGEAPLVHLFDSPSRRGDAVDVGRDAKGVGEAERASKVASHAVQEPIDGEADHILQSMLRDAGVDTGDVEAPTSARRTKSKGSGKKTRKSNTRKKDTLTVDNAVSSTEPCLFENDVRLVSFNGNEMVFYRNSASQPWGLRMSAQDVPPASRSGTADGGGHALPLRLLALPNPLPASVAHPFLKQFAQGNASWLIGAIDGKSAAVSPSKSLTWMRKATKMTLTLLRR